MALDAEQVEGAVCLAWALAALTVVLLMHPKRAATTRRLQQWWKGRSEHERTGVGLTGGLVAAVAAWMVIPWGTLGLVTVLCIIAGSAFVVVLGALLIGDRIRRHRPR